MFDEYSENQEQVQLDLLEFKTAQAIDNIDVVEIMPRTLYELRTDDNNAQFSWIYTRTASITDRVGPISSWDRAAELEKKVRTFLLSLVSIKRNI